MSLLFGRNQSQVLRASRHRSLNRRRLLMKFLEDRLVLAAVTWDGGFWRWGVNRLKAIQKRCALSRFLSSLFFCERVPNPHPERQRLRSFACSHAIGIERLESRVMLDAQGFDFPGRMYDVGRLLGSVAVADVDGDGYIDVVTTGSSAAGTVSVLRSRGDGTFETRVDYSVGYRDPGPSRYVIAADIDGDGHVDLVTVGGSVVSVLRNRGDGTFTARVDYSVGGGPRSIIATDIDGDGHVDLITANSGSNGTVSVLLNRGDGTFAARVDYAVGIWLESITAADIDGDGHVDLITVNNGVDGTVSVLRNLGDGSFAAREDYTVDSYPDSVTAADIDGDGHVDLVTLSLFGDTVVSVLQNLGDGTFADRVSYAVPNASSNFIPWGLRRVVAVADIDGDGRGDLITPDAVLRNQGNGTFAAPEYYLVGTRQFSMTPADINGDGHIDLVTADGRFISVLRNLGGGTFAARRVDYTVQYSPRSVTAADIDGDGLADLISVNSSSISVLQNLGDGTFAPHVSYLIGTSNTNSITAADLDGDGHVDLITANDNSIGTVSVLRNLGDGTFAARADHAVGDSPSSVTAADINGDGLVDLITANRTSNTVSVLRNLGDGTFAARLDYAVGDSPSSVTTADLDGDGHIDLITANYSSGSVSVLRNLGDGTFEAQKVYPVGVALWSVTATDLDGDGHVDLVTADRHISGVVSVLRNLGDGTFATRVTYAVGDSPSSVTAADIDGDGHVDLVTVNRDSNSISVLRNLGDGTFAARVDYAVGDYPHFAVVAEFNQDGYPDLAVASTYSNAVSVLRNLGPQGQDESLADLIVTTVSLQPNSLELGQKLNVEYEVRNISQKSAFGNWLDSIYLSRDNTFDASDLLLARVRHENGLESGQSYTQTIEVPVPFFNGFASGEWHVLVRTDSGHAVPESNKANNTSSSDPLTIDQQVTALTLGQSFVGSIMSGESLYFQVDYTLGDPLAFRLEGLPEDGTVELFVKRDGLPSRSLFDHVSRIPFTDGQYIYLPSQTQSGTFYLAVHSPTLVASPTTFELTAWVPEFGVLTRSFGTAGNAGDFTLEAIGANFDRTVMAHLIDNQGSEFSAKLNYVDDPTRLYATFDLRDVAPGTYDVVFINDADVEVRVPQSLVVVATSEPNPMVPRVIVPSAVRRGLPYSFIVEWENTSQNDAHAPLLTVGNSVPFGTSRDDLNSLGTQQVFLGINTQKGPAGILRPGQRESVTFWSYSDNEPGEHSIWVDRIDPAEIFDWDDVKAQMWPTYLSEEEFESIFQQLIDQAGGTWGDFQGMLARSASLLPYPPEQLRNPDYAMMLAIDNVVATQRPSITGRLVGMIEDFAMTPIIAEDTVTKDVARAIIRADGTFVFPSVKPGTYRLFVPLHELNGSSDVTVEVHGSELIGDLIVSLSTASIYQQLLNAGVDEEIAAMIVSGEIFNDEFNFPESPSDLGADSQRLATASVLGTMTEVLARGVVEGVMWYFLYEGWDFGAFHLRSFLDAVGRDIKYDDGSIISELAKHDTFGRFTHREAAKAVEAAVRELAEIKLKAGEPVPFTLSMEELLQTAGLNRFEGPTFYKNKKNGEIDPNIYNGLIAAFGDMGGAMRRLGLDHSVEVEVHWGGLRIAPLGSQNWRPGSGRYRASIRYLWQDDYSFWNDKKTSLPDLAGYYLENVAGTAKPFLTTIEIKETIHVGIGMPINPYDHRSLYRPGSYDPNDIIGPAGYGPENHIVASATMPYTIRFENDPVEATAPAAIVTITQTLDPNLDWTTFRLGDMGFGDFVVDVPPDTAFFQTRYDVSAELGVFVDIEAGIDIATGQVYWQFTSIDPETGDLPENPLLGFLPPNINAPEGDGFVTYTVRPKADVATGDRVDAIASIVFDVNEPVLTPPIFNTFDIGVPTSSVTPLPQTVVTTSFVVSWDGEDDEGGSGIAFYDIYISIDDGPFQLWLSRTPDTSAVFEGEDGLTYSFYSIATDNVGHREVKSPVVEAMTTVIVGLPGGENATTILRVTTPLDVVNPNDGLLSLREAIIFANQNPGDFVIQLEAETYTLSIVGADENTALTGDLDILPGGRVTILGSGVGQTVIDGGYRFDLATGEPLTAGMGDRIFEVQSGSELFLQQLTVTGGNAANGGAIRNAGTLFTYQFEAIGNSAESGGAIVNEGELTLADTSITENRASNQGGGVYHTGWNAGHAAAYKSHFFANVSGFGGAIANQGEFLLVGGIVSGNQAFASGGGFYNNNPQYELRLEQVLVVDNSSEAGGGLMNYGTVAVVGSTFAVNRSSGDGGAIYNSVSGELLILNATISENEANGWGGGIMSWASARIHHSTIFGNRSDADGDGTGWAGGIYSHDDRLLLDHTIVAGNLDGDGEGIANDIVAYGGIDAASSFNLIGDAESAVGLTAGSDGNLVGVSWQSVLNPELGFFGGSTPMHALVLGGPAIDAGDVNFSPLSFDPRLRFDQRGSGYHRVSGTRIDIGAYERQPEPIGPDPVADRLEPNQTRSTATDLGTLGNVHRWPDLSIHEFAGEDWYRFSTVAVGTQSDDVRIEFYHALGDLDLELYDSVGRLLAGSWSMNNQERIDLNGLPAGDYYLRVISLDGDVNPQYELVVQTPSLSALANEDFESGSISGFTMIPEESDATRIVTGDSYGPGDHAYQMTYTEDEESHLLQLWDFEGETLHVEFAMKLPDGIPNEATERQWANLKNFHIWSTDDRDGEQPIGLYSVFNKYNGAGDAGQDLWQYDTFSLFTDRAWYVEIEPPIDEWIHVKYFIQWNTAGAADGVLLLWLNGELVIDASDVEWLDPTVDRLDGLWIGGNIALGDEQPDRPFRRLIDDVVVIVDSEAPTTNSPPTSKVAPLPEAVATTNFIVSWDGEVGAGDLEIAFYDIYVSIDHEPFELWLSGVSETSAEFDGEDGLTYSFYSVATDNVGHRETKISIAEATTTVVMIQGPPWQNPDLQWDVNADGNVTPLDALLILNEIARRNRNPDLPLAVEYEAPFYDVNGDNRITPLDALLILNYIARRNRGGFAESVAEGELVAFAVPVSEIKSNRLAAEENVRFGDDDWVEPSLTNYRSVTPSFSDWDKPTAGAGKANEYLRSMGARDWSEFDPLEDVIDELAVGLATLRK